jgi:protein-S-isoprenylcysteine O-methyltransferase Ste14
MGEWEYGTVYSILSSKQTLNMKNAKDSPGVFIPPPLIYAAFFIFSMILQGYLTIKGMYFFHKQPAIFIGTLLNFAGIFFIFPAMFEFIKTKNTIITLKPATSLQTTGIYSYSRNPMYMGLILIYLGLTLQFGNWWTIFLLPILIIVITYRVILPEERYLARAFGDEYAAYKKKVRRWI